MNYKDIIPVPGTEILFMENERWWNKNSEGVITQAWTLDYLKRYKDRNSLVVIKGEDDIYLTNLNNSVITIVVNKFIIERPNLVTFDHTKEWISLTHFLQIKKMTNIYCNVAPNFYIPSK